MLNLMMDDDDEMRLFLDVVSCWWVVSRLPGGNGHNNIQSPKDSSSTNGTSQGRRPLHYAAEAGRAPVAELLLRILPGDRQGHGVTARIPY